MLYNAIFQRLAFPFPKEKRQVLIGWIYQMKMNTLKDVLRIPNGSDSFLSSDDMGPFVCKDVEWPAEFDGQEIAKMTTRSLILACLEPKDDAERIRRVLATANAIMPSKDYNGDA